MIVDQEILISIVIPVKNGKSTLKQCLNAIFNQTLINQTEVIIIDSGSTDNSLEIVKHYPVRLYQIPPTEFNHGGTRNYGVTLAKGEIVVMTVQDAIPVSNIWLQKFKECFEKSNADAVCGRQIVTHDVRHNPAIWYNPVSKAKYEEVFFKTSTALNQLTPLQKRELMAWDDVNSAYRKIVLQELPFPKTMFAEDLLWCQKALSGKKKLVFDHSIQVSHYHHEQFASRFKRILIEGIFDYKTFGLKHYNRFSTKKLITLIWNLNKNVKSFYLKIKWTVYNVKLFLAHKMAKIYLSFLLIIEKRFVHNIIDSKLKHIKQPIGGNK